MTSKEGLVAAVLILRSYNGSFSNCRRKFPPCIQNLCCRWRRKFPPSAHYSRCRSSTFFPFHFPPLLSVPTSLISPSTLTFLNSTPTLLFSLLVLLFSLLYADSKLRSFSAAMAPFIRQVWNWNLQPELAILEQALRSFPVLSVDCEFPGFLLQTPRNATDDLRYSDLKHNVDRTHIIQLGLTLSDFHRGAVFGTWQFNFEFDLDKDLHTKETVTFLRGHGIDFETHKADGIKKTQFAAQFINLMARRTCPLLWVTFHGLYDFAHILKLLTNGTPLPNKPSGFRDLLGCYFEKIVDLKVMAKFCQGISDMEVGLQKLADFLNVKREGEAHQAGSDSLLTALVFSNMRSRFQVHQHVFSDYLYGISEKIGRRTPTFKAAHYSSQQRFSQPMPVLLIPCYPPPAQCRFIPLHTPFITGQY